LDKTATTRVRIPEEARLLPSAPFTEADDGQAVFAAKGILTSEGGKAFSTLGASWPAGWPPRCDLL